MRHSLDTYEEFIQTALTRRMTFVTPRIHLRHPLASPIFACSVKISHKADKNTEDFVPEISPNIVALARLQYALCYRLNKFTARCGSYGNRCTLALANRKLAC